MTAQQIASVLAWCTGVGYATLVVWAVAWLGLRDAIYRLHGHWFRVERATYDAIVFAMIGAFKLALLVLFVFPLIALYGSGVVGTSP